MCNIFDTHSHYDDHAFDSDRDELLSALPSKGVCGVISCGTDIATGEFNLRLAERYDHVFAACGIHPEQAPDMAPGDLDALKTQLKHPKCVALGEIGLDYYWDIPKDVQREVFEYQLELAVSLDMPVIIHDREAHADVLELIKKYRPRGVMHCFSGSVETAKEVLKTGMYLGFGGSVTFKNAVRPVEAAKFVPADRLLLETDCPYMAPVPFRGKRNDSSLIEHIAVKIAEIRQTDAQQLLDQTAANARECFCLT